MLGYDIDMCMSEKVRSEAICQWISYKKQQKNNRLCQYLSKKAKHSLANWIFWLWTKKTKQFEDAIKQHCDGHDGQRISRLINNENRVLLKAIKSPKGLDTATWQRASGLWQPLSNTCGPALPVLSVAYLSNWLFRFQLLSTVSHHFLFPFNSSSRHRLTPVKAKQSLREDKCTAAWKEFARLSCLELRFLIFPIMQISRMWSRGYQVCLRCLHLQGSAAAAVLGCHCVGALTLPLHCG